MVLRSGLMDRFMSRGFMGLIRNSLMAQPLYEEHFLFIFPTIKGYNTNVLLDYLNFSILERNKYRRKQGVENLPEQGH